MRKVIPVAAVVVLLTAAFSFTQWATEAQCLIVGIGLVAIALPLTLLSRVQLGRAFAVGPKATTLVTSGLYSKIPHPMYVFLDLALLGIVIAVRVPGLLGLLATLVVIQAWQSTREAKVLEDAFGEQYREYRARTWW